MNRGVGRRGLIRAMAALGALGCGALAAQPGEPLPQVNLRVELRQTEAAERQASELGGRVVIRAGERVGARVDAGAEARDSASELGARQQVLVLNGGRAGVRLAQSMPLQWLQAVPLPPAAGGPGFVLVPGTVFIEAGQGFTVQPRWPGGTAPVWVEVATEGGRLGGTWGGGAAVRQQSQVLTTLQLPLGEWVTVAESADEERQRDSGLLSRRSQSGSHRLQVQMRVTAP